MRCNGLIVFTLVHVYRLLIGSLSNLDLLKTSWSVDPFHFVSLVFMSDLDIQVPAAYDPFADANAENSGAGAKDYVHIRVQQRNGRKSLTTVQGLDKQFSYSKILKDLKKEFCCNGTVVQDPELGQVIQLQGDQRKNVSTFLVQVLLDHLPAKLSVPEYWNVVLSWKNNGLLIPAKHELTLL
ncbi:hypothetical protein Cgig2_029690 [Carnegiea gigantea]|uniref:SUI1 domain-containing protein n=1 Tax=Carnegiea gigantea TaxID=171969 RepID=A0A9Q1KIX5_9CARY|nr:hypothetical protein Cgig2_029690 [Carnegiea gigantea]